MRALDRLRAYRAKRKLRDHPNFVIASSAKVNWQGLVARPPSSLRIGDGSIFEGTVASERGGTEVSIGSNTFIGSSQIICAMGVHIGNDVLISFGCTITDHDSHALAWNDRSKDVREWHNGIKDWSRVEIRPVRICDKTWIGCNVLILKGVVIGEGAVIGAGSVITKDVEAFTLVAGNPARVIRRIEHGSD